MLTGVLLQWIWQDNRLLKDLSNLQKRVLHHINSTPTFALLLMPECIHCDSFLKSGRVQAPGLRHFYKSALNFQASFNISFTSDKLTESAKAI